MNENNTEKPHTCSKCGGMRSTIAELLGDIRSFCRQLEKGVGPAKKVELQAKIADFKERVRKQKEWYQEHLDEATYSPKTS